MSEQTLTTELTHQYGATVPAGPIATTVHARRIR